MTELLNLIFGRNLDETQQKKRDFYTQAIPQAAQTAEAYFNPMSALRTLSAPAKQDLLKALRKAFPKGGRSTSAIDMAYGKRRNYRAKRSYRSRSSGRKRLGKRRSRSRKSNASSSTLSVLKKALSGNMSY